MYIFAYVCLLLALLVSLGGAGAALIQLWEGKSSQLRVIANAQWLVTGCLLLASALLLHALFWGDYRLDYVASYTDALLPAFYKLTAFWAGQPGSLLFWALMTALCGPLFLISKASKKLSAVALLWFWCLFYACMAFFCLLLTSWSNPFIILNPAPADGSGLNPLLQNPGMIFHPPLLFMGYAAFTVPACLCLGQLASGENGSWIMAARPYIISGWSLLTAGIVLGAWWAYMELGWGGYWAWDPVENASLLPWLSATASIHLMAARRATGNLGRTCAMLTALTLALAFFGTWLTRSGVIQSVHAFGDGGVGIPLLIFVVAFCCLILFICCTSRPDPATPVSPASRTGLLILAAWVFLAITLIVLLATLWPVLSQFSSSAPQGLDASFYNNVCLPLGALLLLLLLVCPALGWKTFLAKGSAWMLGLTACVFAAAVAGLWLSGIHLPLALFASASAIAIACLCLAQIFLPSTWKNRFQLSALGAHLGLALFALGVAFSGPYTLEKELLLGRGQSETVGPYAIRLMEIADGAGPGYDWLKASLEVSENGKPVGVLTPERRIYAKFGDMQFSEVDVISSPGEDVYASLLGMDEEYHALVKISLEPLVSLLWLGGALMCVLPLLPLLFLRKRTAEAG